MKQARLVIDDEVNVHFYGVDKKVRTECNNLLKHFIPQAVHLPQYKLGYWDGSVSNFSISGHTYYNLLNKVLPIIVDKHQYDLTVEDNRVQYDFEFDPIDEDYIADFMPKNTWPVGTPNAGTPIVLRDYQCDSINQMLGELQSVGWISTGAGKCIDYNTEVNVQLDENSDFYKFLLNKGVE